MHAFQRRRCKRPPRRGRASPSARRAWSNADLQRLQDLGALDMRACACASAAACLHDCAHACAPVLQTHMRTQGQPNIDAPPHPRGILSAVRRVRWWHERRVHGQAALAVFVGNIAHADAPRGAGRGGSGERLGPTAILIGLVFPLNWPPPSYQRSCLPPLHSFSSCSSSS